MKRETKEIGNRGKKSGGINTSPSQPDSSNCSRSSLAETWGGGKANHFGQCGLDARGSCWFLLGGE